MGGPEGVDHGLVRYGDPRMCFSMIISNAAMLTACVSISKALLMLSSLARAERCVYASRNCCQSE